MNFKLIALSALSITSLAPAPAGAKDTPAAGAYTARVDPAAFADHPLHRIKHGVTVSPAMVRLITPGVDKFSIYNLIGPPHFDEGITRKWNYVLFFPPEDGSSERQRCRMEIRFGRERKDGYNVSVSEVIWQDQACADRVAAAG